MNIFKVIVKTNNTRHYGKTYNAGQVCRVSDVCHFHKGRVPKNGKIRCL